MDLLLGGTEPPKNPESWMKRYFKPLLVLAALVASLFLTIGRKGPAGGIGVSAQRKSRAAPQRSSKQYNLTALRVFTVVLGRIKDHYVEPNRIKPKRMLVAALDAIERTVAEVQVEEIGHKKVKVKVQDSQRTFDLAGVDSPWSLSSRMKEVLRFLQPHLNASTNIRDVEYSAINGMLSTLDPHSLLLKPEIYDEMKLSTRGEFGGLGIVISMIKGVLTVMNPMKGTPAYAVGIKPCDQILKIGEESTVNMTLSQAVSRLRGIPGSKVYITIKRVGWSKPVRKTIVRAIIKVDSVTSRMLKKKVGYVRLSSFQGNSHADIRQHVRELRRKGMKGLVLDLRGNPGGLLGQAIKISDMFIDSGTLLTTVSHAGKQREEKRAKSEGTEDRYPVAVLVNSGSASASEIVAGALKNLNRAVIIGTRTFGKGSVQVLYDNDDGSALKLTIAQYLTPGDVSIQSVGIQPDIATRPVVVRKEYIRLRRRAAMARESDLRQHLTHRNARRNVKPSRELRYLAQSRAQKSKKKQKKPKEQKNLCLYPDRACSPENQDKFVVDFQIRLARDLLATTKYWRRNQVIRNASGLFAQLEREEQRRITAELKKLGVDWSDGGQKQATAKGSVTGRPRLRVTIRGNTVRACQGTKLTVTVKNTGPVAALQLEGVSASNNRMLSGLEFTFGRVEPGGTRSWSVPVRMRDAPTRMDAVTLKFYDAQGNKYPEQKLQVRTVGVQRPIFAYGYQLIDDVIGNRDGRVQRGERARLLVKVRNTGKGRAFRVVTTLKNLAGVGIFIRKGRFVLNEMAPGETKTASFTFDVQRAFASKSFKLQLRVSDYGLNESVVDKLTFDVAGAGDALTLAKGSVRVNSARVALRAWADKSAPVVGTAARATAFKVLGRLTGWYRVEAEKNRPAFVPAQAVTPGGTPSGRGFSARFQVTPPKLKVNVPAHITSAKSIKISGEATDETRIADLFIFVRNPSANVDGRKVFYRSNRHAKSPTHLAFSTDVPLWPGANYVTVFARENDEVRTIELVVIFRNDNSGKSKAPSPVPPGHP